jgi:hypothetical protein
MASDLHARLIRAQLSMLRDRDGEILASSCTLSDSAVNEQIEVCSVDNQTATNEGGWEFLRPDGLTDCPERTGAIDGGLFDREKAGSYRLR